MKLTPVRIAGIVVTAGFVVSLPFSLTIVSEESIADRTQADTFDPVAYVDDIWDSEILPTVADEAVDVATVLDAFEVDDSGIGTVAELTAVVEEYGAITDGEAHVYMVRGEATVESVDTKGIATVTVDGYEGPIVLTIYMGTRIPSDETSLRDAVGFIEFGDFREQTEFGKVASEINKRVVSDVIDPVDTTTLTGERIAFTGTFGIRTFNLVAIDLSTITVVPTSIEISG